MRAPGSDRNGQDAALTTLSARLSGHVGLEVQPSGRVVAVIGPHSVDVGQLSASMEERALNLRTGLPLHALGSEIEPLVRRLASQGLLEYCLRSPAHRDEVIIEPQVSDYWPRQARLADADILVLSRFAYLRRRGNEMVLESPLSGALFKISNPSIAAVVAMLSKPRQIRELCDEDAFPGIEFLGLLVDCQILFKTDAACDRGPRAAEGDDSLVLWDFHDLLFHARSTVGRHANPLGGLYPYADLISPLPALRPSWPGKRINLQKFPAGKRGAISPTAKLLRERRSTRIFDDQRPITLAELSRLLDSTARVQSKWTSSVAMGDSAPLVAYASRPYPSAGGSYELELYLTVNKCEGLARGFYYYDADRHALVVIDVSTRALEALLAEAEFAMGAPATPQILITIAARFGRVAWKYSSLAYALILKDAGVLTQTLYIMATDLGLGGCAIGSTNIDLFAKMIGVEFPIEGPVGQFAIGRGAKSEEFGEHGGVG